MCIVFGKTEHTVISCDPFNIDIYDMHTVFGKTEQTVISGDPFNIDIYDMHVPT
jgi:hypothetical protein